MITRFRLDPVIIPSAPRSGSRILRWERLRNGLPKPRPCGRTLPMPNNLNQPTTQMEIPQKLRDYINESRAPLPPVSDPDEPLQIDSLGLIRLVAFMESDCGIRVEGEELVAEHFASLRSLGELIERKAQ